MKSYTVRFSFNIEEHDGETARPFFDVQPIAWFGLPYVGMVAIQQLALRILNVTASWGVARVEADGEGDKLKAMLS